MLRKGTTLIMLWLMTVVIATSQPGLSYCFCLKGFFVGECECVELVKEGTCPRVCDEGRCDNALQETSEIEEELPHPCQDCSLSLQLELDDFIGVNSIQTPNHEGFEFITPLGQSGEIDFLFSFKNSFHGIRGSPPPVAGLASSVPLRVWYSVFLV